MEFCLEHRTLLSVLEAWIYFSPWGEKVMRSDVYHAIVISISNFLSAQLFPSEINHITRTFTLATSSQDNGLFLFIRLLQTNAYCDWMNFVFLLPLLTRSPNIQKAIWYIWLYVWVSCRLLPCGLLGLTFMVCTLFKFNDKIQWCQCMLKSCCRKWIYSNKW